MTEYDHDLGPEWEGFLPRVLTHHGVLDGGELVNVEEQPGQVAYQEDHDEAHEDASQVVFLLPPRLVDRDACVVLGRLLLGRTWQLQLRFCVSVAGRGGGRHGRLVAVVQCGESGRRRCACRHILRVVISVSLLKVK